MATNAARSRSDKPPPPPYSVVPPSPASITPVTRWRSSINNPVLSTEALNSHEAQMREQRRLREEQGQRRASLELLEIQSMNRTLDQQHRQDQREVARLAHERAELLRTNITLRSELDEARASLKYLRHQGRLSKALDEKQTAQTNSKRNARHDAEEQLERYRADIFCSTPTTTATDVRGGGGGVQNPEPDCNDSSVGSIENASSTETEMSEDYTCLLPELVERVHSSLTGTVSSWVKGMQAACCPEIKQALVLPWLLHKLFYLCSELIEEKRQEVATLFLGGVVCEPGKEQATMGAEASESMQRHLRRHQLTLFPLSGDSLGVAVDKIIMALAYSMIDSKEWDPSAKNPDAVFEALVASELGTIVEDYIVIMVMCCLQQPAVTFSDDLGEVQRFNPEVHSEPIDGERADEDSCIIVFPALKLAADGGGARVGGKGSVVGKRFVLKTEEEEEEE